MNNEEILKNIIEKTSRLSIKEIEDVISVYKEIVEKSNDEKKDILSNIDEMSIPYQYAIIFALNFLENKKIFLEDRIYDIVKCSTKEDIVKYYNTLIGKNFSKLNLYQKLFLITFLLDNNMWALLNNNKKLKEVMFEHILMIDNIEL